LASTAAQKPSTNTVHNTTADNNKPATIAMLLSPRDILKKGFPFFNELPNNFAESWTERRTNDLKCHYGSSPIVLTNQWYVLMPTKLNMGLTQAENLDKGFKMFPLNTISFGRIQRTQKYLVPHFWSANGWFKAIICGDG
jgi:hypothetical protein